MIPPILQKLAPFIRRANLMVNGRGKLAHCQKKLALLFIAPDLSQNSRNFVAHTFHCPVFETLTSEEILQLFGLENTKIMGILQSSLATSLLQELQRPPESPAVSP